MRMPGGWPHRSCDWCVQFSLRAGFCRPFSSAFFFSASGSSPLLSISWTFLCFFCLFLRRFGPHASQHGEQHLGFAWPVRSRVVSEWWIRPLNHIKFHFFVLLYLVALFGLSLSRDSDSGHLPGFSAVATSDVGSFSGERSTKSYQAIPARPLSTCRSSSLAGRVTVPHFFLLIRLLVFLWFLVLLSHPSRCCRHHPCAIIHSYNSAHHVEISYLRNFQSRMGCHRVAF